MQTSVGVYEAKTHFPSLLKAVGKGVTYSITVRGNPVAELRPIPSASEQLAQTFQKMQDLQDKVSSRGKLGGLEFIQMAKVQGRR